MMVVPTKKSVTASEIAECLGKFREVLSRVAEGGPADEDDEYRELRASLLQEPLVKPLLPDFVTECRRARDFWNYIKRAFEGAGAYEKRSQYIEAQLLPLERQFRPERLKAPGIRPPEVRIEYTPVRPVASSNLTFVNEDRLAELRSISSNAHDLTKLIRMCEELNVVYSEGCFLATAMLTRALMDHVPPIFKKRSFIEVANNHGGRSFKKLMQHIEGTARNIADAHLHQPIRRRETLPTQQQVNFSAAVDRLLEEVCLELR